MSLVLEKSERQRKPARLAGDKRRKTALETAQQCVALSQASAVLLKGAVQAEFNPIVVRQLCEIINADKKKATAAGPVSGHCEAILANYGELHVRVKETEEVEDEKYDKYDDIMKEKRLANKEVQELLKSAVAASVTAFETEAAKRARNPVAIRNVAVLAQMGYSGLGTTAGPESWTATAQPGQCLHEDVMLPEVQGLAYWSGGNGTLAFNGEEMSYEAMEVHTGMKASDFTKAGPTRISYYQAKNLMLPSQTLEEGLTDIAWRDGAGAKVSTSVADGRVPVVEAGDLGIMDGGVPHAGPAVSAGCWQVRLFMIASPLRTMHPYEGYIQIIGGEVELFWACMAKTADLRWACYEAWEAALPYWAGWYKKCGMQESEGPVRKVLLAIVAMCGEGDCSPAECAQARYILCCAIKHVKERKDHLSLHKWSCLQSDYPELSALRS